MLTFQNTIQQLNYISYTFNYLSVKLCRLGIIDITHDIRWYNDLT